MILLIFVRACFHIEVLAQYEKYIWHSYEKVRIMWNIPRCFSHNWRWDQAVSSFEFFIAHSAGA